MDAADLYKKPAVVADRAHAEATLRALVREKLLDPTRAIVRGETVTLPVFARPDLAEVAARLGARLIEQADLDPREPRRSPYEQVLDRLPEEMRSLAPDKWELLGDVLVLRFPETPHARELAAIYADVLGATTVLRDVSGVAGELREMSAEFLFGDDAVTTHLENGVKYRLDASRIMFSSGNKHERARVIEATGETVVDMFAGIGYFAIPLAMRGGPARVIAMEKNPVSFQYLVENARLNQVTSVVEPWLGDNREYPRTGFADRVLMGYFPETAKFLPTALSFLKPEGGRIHYHDTAHERVWKDEMTRAFLDAARACGRVVVIEESRVVKSHSPGVVHAVIVGRIR